MVWEQSAKLLLTLQSWWSMFCWSCFQQIHHTQHLCTQFCWETCVMWWGEHLGRFAIYSIRYIPFYLISCIFYNVYVWWHQTITWTNVDLSSVRSSEGNFTADISTINQCNWLEKYSSKISLKSPRPQWVNVYNFWDVLYAVTSWCNTQSMYSDAVCSPVSYVVSVVRKLGYAAVLRWQLKRFLDSKTHEAKHAAHLGLTGPRWAPFLPHELGYLGNLTNPLLTVSWGRDPQHAFLLKEEILTMEVPPLSQHHHLWYLKSTPFAVYSMSICQGFKASWRLTIYYRTHNIEWKPCQCNSCWCLGNAKSHCICCHDMN